MTDKPDTHRTSQPAPVAAAAPAALPMERILERPILSLELDHVDNSSAWLGHLPFALWLIDAIRPRSLVELGTHTGVSYCAFCQAIGSLDLRCRAYAVDTWDGDAHTGNYARSVYATLRQHHDARYAAFSELVRTTFDNAVPKFADGSIDLLHIDGLHTYDAVRHDFDTWLPKMSERGVVLFHDTNVFERDFGVQTLWRDLQGTYPGFEFLHGHGLGVLAVGSAVPPRIEWLTQLSDDQTVEVRRFFTDAARRHIDRAERSARHDALREDHAALQRRHDELQHAHNAQSDAMTQLETAHELRQQHVDNLELQLQDGRGQLEQTRRELSNAHVTSSRLARENARVSQELASTTLELERQSAAREHVAAEATKLRQDIGIILGGMSWRVTAPLRWLARRVISIRNLLKPGAPGTAAQGLAALPVEQQAERSYGTWIDRYDRLSPGDLRQIERHIAGFERQPTVSVLVPVYNTNAEFLRRCIDSMLDQLYPHWELCLADDASDKPHVRSILEQYAARDPRIKIELRETNGNISAASNSALELATGEFVALLDHDDELPTHALYMVVAALNEDPDLDVIFTDEDKIDEHGRRFDPHFKCDFNLELLQGQNCISHLGVYRRSIVTDIGGFREGFEGSQDYDLALRAVEKAGPASVHHIPFVLYHWRVFDTSGSFSTDHLHTATDAARRAIAEFCQRRDAAARVVAGGAGSYHRVKRPLPDPAPRVSIVVPTRDNVRLLRQCVDGIRDRTRYPNLDVTVIDNDSRDPETLAYLDDLADAGVATVLRYRKPFNFSAINNFAVAKTSGSLICLMNDDVSVIHDDWLDEMVAQVLAPGVGIVGARLLYPDDTVQHGGVVLGIQGVANHLHKNLYKDHGGYFGRAQLTQNLSAVTAACMVVRRSVFDEVGGLDEEHLAVAFNDVDFCLRAARAGHHIVWTPHATLYHHESASRGSDLDPDKVDRFSAETEYMMNTWGPELSADPFYNPNLTIDDVDLSLAFPPRVEKPWVTWAAGRRR